MKKLFFVVVILVAYTKGRAQEPSIRQDGEFGISAGAAHYFGDLNPHLRLNRPKPDFGVFFRKQFSNYVALRISGHFTQLGYSDIYNSYNQFMYQRNLSFNTNIWEFALQGDFNFYRFIPGDPYHNFTPYITFGIGAFSYDPYAYYQGQQVYLRPLGTEGQGSAAYPDRKPYGTMAVCLPLGVGIKYSINARINLGFEIVYRFTGTDYIDDVSKTYAPDAQPQFLPNGNPTLWYLLQDRSYETGSSIGIKGRQRGYSAQNDSYVIGEFMLTFNLSSYHCPTAN
jgi:hypothetical protein